MTDLSSLIERIEKSEGADHEIDAAIELAFTDDRGVQPLAFFKHKITIGKRRTIPFTASIDAAMSLVPDGATGWSFNNDRLENEALIFRDGDGVIGRGNARTPALALCAAALKARNPSHEG